MDDCKKTAQEITALVHEWEPRLKVIDETKFSGRRNSQNRTVKQIVGHLVDSASNNLHRIIHLQYRESPLDFPDYANLGVNDRWIALQNYRDEEWVLILQLWKYSNLHLTHVIENIDPKAVDNIWVSALNERITLREMVVDYPSHLKLHLQEIADLAELSNGNRQQFVAKAQ